LLAPCPLCCQIASLPACTGTAGCRARPRRATRARGAPPAPSRAVRPSSPHPRLALSRACMPPLPLSLSRSLARSVCFRARSVSPFCAEARAAIDRLGLGGVLPPGARVQRARGLALLQGARAADRPAGLRLLPRHVVARLHVCRHGTHKHSGARTGAHARARARSLAHSTLSVRSQPATARCSRHARHAGLRPGLVWAMHASHAWPWPLPTRSGSGRRAGARPRRGRGEGVVWLAAGCGLSERASERAGGRLLPGVAGAGRRCLCAARLRSPF
jgi:hypothetical protein